jgi:hypothetical protein
MKASDFVSKVRENLALLRQNREAEVKRIAFDLTARIKSRIQGSGKNYLNQQFSPYTPAYAKQRQKAGAQTNYVDFTRTGRLFASVYPDTDENSAVVTVVISAHGQDNIDKVRGAERKRGNILRPSQDELDLAEQANNARVQKYLQI